MSPDRVARGRALAERRAALGVSSQAEFARRVGMSRTTIAKAELGTASENTYLELEAWLNAEAGQQRGDSEGDDAPVGRIEFDIIGPSTEWRVTVSGPIEDAERVREQATELAREIARRAPEMQKEAPERN